MLDAIEARTGVSRSAGWRHLLRGLWLSGLRASLASCKRLFADFGERAGIIVGKPPAKSKKTHKYASAHDLRRAFGDRWAKRLLPQQLQRLMRHEAIQTTLTYYVSRDAADLSKVLWDHHSHSPSKPTSFGNRIGNSSESDHFQKAQEFDVTP